jgi:hypothetical protein
MSKYFSAVIICALGAGMGMSFARTARADKSRSWRDDEHQLIVAVDKSKCPDATFTKIQDAVNAAEPGSHIRVCPGTYPEQVSISKPLSIEGDNGAIVMPSGMVQNTTSLFDGTPAAAVVLVRNTDGVTLENLTVDAANNGISGCAPTLIGVFYRNASGSVSDLAVRNMLLSQNLSGCQSGLGIFAQSGSGGTSRVVIESSSVHDYQKNGITGNEAGTELVVRSNVVTGIGPTTGAAQNGVQIGFGASGEVTSNQVANHIYSPCAATTCAASATNILVVNSDDVNVTGNTSGISQGGIVVQGNRASVEQNEVFGTAIFDGITLAGDRNDVEGNDVTHSAESGIFVQGNDNEIERNRIHEAPIGVLKISGSLGNDISDNSFFNTPTPVMDPAPQAAGRSAKAFR